MHWRPHSHANEVPKWWSLWLWSGVPYAYHILLHDSCLNPAWPTIHSEQRAAGGAHRTFARQPAPSSACRPTAGRQDQDGEELSAMRAMRRYRKPLCHQRTTHLVVVVRKTRQLTGHWQEQRNRSITSTILGAPRPGVRDTSLHTNLFQDRARSRSRIDMGWIDAISCCSGTCLRCSLAVVSCSQRGFEKSARRTIGACLTGDNKTVLCVFIANAKGQCSVCMAGSGSCRQSSHEDWTLSDHGDGTKTVSALLLPW
jgi:hypothetical protein